MKIHFNPAKKTKNNKNKKTFSASKHCLFQETQVLNPFKLSHDKKIL